MTRPFSEPYRAAILILLLCCSIYIVVALHFDNCWAWELSLLRPVNGKGSLCVTVLAQQYFSSDPFLEFAAQRDVWVAYVSFLPQICCYIYYCSLLLVMLPIFPTETFLIFFKVLQILTKLLAFCSFYWPFPFCVVSVSGNRRSCVLNPEVLAGMLLLCRMYHCIDRKIFNSQLT